MSRTPTQIARDVFGLVGSVHELAPKITKRAAGSLSGGGKSTVIRSQSQGKGFNLKGAILDQMMPKSMDFNGFQ